MRIFSSGWGVDSTAVFILQILGRIEPYEHFVFANVGEDSENPDTIAYIKNVVEPVAEKHGISLVEVRALGLSLYERLMSDQKSVVIPAYTRRGGGKLHRNCTSDYKVIPVQNWIKERASEVVIGLGIAIDEIERMRSMEWYEEGGLRKRREYPLIDLRLSRQDCLNIISNFGLPEPPASRCTYCPFNTVNFWNRQYEKGGGIWERSLRVDKRIRGKESSVQGRAYLHRYGIPLDQAVGIQMALDYDASDDCDASCGT